MTGMPTRQLTLPHAATEDSESPATAFAGTGLGAGLNAIIDDAKGTAVKVGSGASAVALGKVLVGTGVADADGNQQSIWDRHERKNIAIGGSAQLWDQGTSPAVGDNVYIGGNWRLLIEGANAVTVTRETSDVPAGGAAAAWKVICGSSPNQKSGLFWVAEGDDVHDLVSGAVSIQAAMKATAGLTNMKAAPVQWVGTKDATTGDPILAWGADGVTPTLVANWSYLNTPANLSATTSWLTKYIAENAAVGASMTNLGIFIWNDNNTSNTQTTDAYLVTDVQLERGAVCTMVERRSKALHQLEDSRFFDKSYDETVAPGTASQNNGLVTFLTSDTNTLKNLLTSRGFKARMRAVPTVTLYDVAGNSGKLTTVDASLNQTQNVTPGGSTVGDAGFYVNHTVAGAGIYFHYKASARI